MILGVLLAAGTGSRFAAGTGSSLDEESELYGENKLLADLDGQSIVAHAARTLAESSLDAAVAVVGHDAEAVERALPENIETVANPDYEQGQSTSVRRGITTAHERDADAVLFALGDMPCVSVATVEAVLDAYRDSDSHTGISHSGIVAPRFDGQRGNPVLFDSRHFDALTSVEGDTGGRRLLESEPVTWVDVEDSGIHRDVDTLADLREIRNE